MHEIRRPCRPFLPRVERLEARDLPTVTMFPEVRGTPGHQYVVEVIRVDSTPTNLTFSQVNGVISVTADQTIVNRSFSSSVTIPANRGTAQIDGSLLNIRAVETHGRSGRNRYTVRSTDALDNPTGAASLTVFSGAGDAITLGGAADGADSIHGSVSVWGSAGGATLALDDRAYPSSRSVTLEASGLVNGLGAPIYFSSRSSLSALSLELGGGSSTVNVWGTPVPTSIVCGGDATVNVGNGVVEEITNALKLLPGAGRPTLNIRGQDLGVGRAITLSTGRGDGTTATLTGLTPAPISFDDARTAAVNLDLGREGLHTLTVDGSADATDRTIDVSAWSPSRVHLGGTDVGRITGLMPTAITFSPEGVGDLTIHTGTGKAQVNVTNAARPDSQTTLVGHSARTFVNVVEPVSTLGGAQGPLTVANTVPRGTRLTVSGPSPSPSVVAAVGVPTYRVVTDARTGQRVSFRPTAVADLTLRPQESVTVAATLVPTTVVAPANSGVTVTPGGILAPLTVTSSASRGPVMLTLDNSADPADRTVTLKSTARAWFDANRVQHNGHVVTGLAAAPISYDTPSVSFLRLYTGTGVEKVNLPGGGRAEHPGGGPLE